MQVKIRNNMLYIYKHKKKPLYPLNLHRKYHEEQNSTTSAVYLISAVYIFGDIYSI